MFDDENFRSEVAEDLFSMGRTHVKLPDAVYLAEPERTTEHFGPTFKSSWFRSKLWFYIRFTIQSSLGHPYLGAYKAFMLFFMCNLADYATSTNTHLSSTLLHSMTAKLLRRFRKLHSSVLSDAVSQTCTNISRVLDQRWQRVQTASFPSPPWDPSLLDLTNDVQFPSIHEHISTSFTNLANDSPRTSSFPSSQLRGTLDDFLSNRGRLLSPPKGGGDIHVTLYDVERAIREDLDDWVARVTDIDKACEQLERLVHRYRSLAQDIYWKFSGRYDKLFSLPSEFLPRGRSPLQIPPSPPLSRGSSPPLEIFPRIHSPLPVLKTFPYHHPHFPHFQISLSRRPCRPVPRELLPLPITIDPRNCSVMLLTIIELWVALDKLVLKKFPILVEYSPEVPLYLLYGLLLHDTTSIDRFRRAQQYIAARHTQAHRGWSVLSDTFTEDSFPCRYYDNQLQHLKVGDELPVNSLPAKVVLFESRCPVAFDKWRSVTCLLSRIKPDLKRGGGIEVSQIPALKPYFPTDFKRSLSLYSTLGGGLYYVYDGPCMGSSDFVYELPAGPYTDSGLQAYLSDTTPQPNEALAAQRNCHSKLPLQAFIAFAHLQSGGSLQWLNILRELWSRTLDFRHQEVYLLFAQASTKVGPVDDTGELLWHQEMKDSSFCHALLEELKSLFVDVGVGSSNGPAMAIITLLAGVLASRPFGHIAEQALDLLCDVRQKTYGWVHELLYDMRELPTNEEGSELLRDMAAVCRSTFDVGSATSHKLFRSTLDIEISLSCAMVMHTIAPPSSKSYIQSSLGKHH